MDRNNTMNEERKNMNNTNEKNRNNNRATDNSNNGQSSDSRLHAFFTNQLKDIYWAEKMWVKTLPKMQDAAMSDELKNAFSSHLKQTEQQVRRLEEVFSKIGVQPEAVKCQAMAGIIEEGEQILGETEKNTAQRDVGLIFASQKAEHYEIATYGGLTTLAKTLGLNEVADLLYQTLQEEEHTDKRLTKIAESGVNRKASRELVEA